MILFVRRDLMQIYFFAVRLTCGIYYTYYVLCYSTNVQEVVIFLTKCWKIAGDRSRYVQFNYWYSIFWNMSWVNWTKIGHWKELFLLACKPFHPNLARDPSTCICWVCFSIPDRGAEYCDKRVCLSVCLSVSVCLSTITSSIFTNFLCTLPVAVTQSSSGGVMIRYVLPVLWMTSYLLISQGCSTSPPSCGATHTQPWVQRWA